MISKVPSRHGKLIIHHGRAVVKGSNLGEKAARGLNLGSAFTAFIIVVVFVLFTEMGTDGQRC